MQNPDTDAPIFAPDAFRIATTDAKLIERPRQFGAKVWSRSLIHM